MSNSLTSNSTLPGSAAETLRSAEQDFGAPAFDYKEAFSRNLGLISEEEQEKLRNSRVAIAGMGGVGGIHLITLARLGIGKFTIADPDTFELANFNRQYGARVQNISRSKVRVMAEEALSINPELDIRTIDKPVSEANVNEFLDGADVFVDGVDFFTIDARRLIFREARRRGIWSVTAGPHAFGSAWLTFDPKGMSFDEYFDIDDQMDPFAMIIKFAVGGTPSPIHLKYLNISKFFQPEQKKAGSVGLGCNFASGIVGTEVARILLGWPGVRPAPKYAQFDARLCRIRKGTLWWGNRHPWQRLKCWWLANLARKSKPGPN